MPGFLRAQDENRTIRFFDSFLGDGAVRNSTPAGHAVGGDDEKWESSLSAIRTISMPTSLAVPICVRTLMFLADRLAAGSERRFFGGTMKALIVFAFLQNRDAAGQIGNRGDDIDENQLGAEARGEVDGGNVESII